MKVASRFALKMSLMILVPSCKKDFIVPEETQVFDVRVLGNALPKPGGPKQQSQASKISRGKVNTGSKYNQPAKPVLNQAQKDVMNRAILEQRHVLQHDGSVAYIEKNQLAGQKPVFNILSVGKQGQVTHYEGFSLEEINHHARLQDWPKYIRDGFQKDYY